MNVRMKKGYEIEPQQQIGSRITTFFSSKKLFFNERDVLL